VIESAARRKSELAAPTMIAIVAAPPVETGTEIATRTKIEIGTTTVTATEPAETERKKKVST